MTLLDTTAGLVHKGVLAYVGVFLLGTDAVSQSFGVLAKRGAQAQQTAFGELSKLADRTPLLEIRDYVEQGRNQLIDALGLPSQEALYELKGQIERLSAALDDLRVKTRRHKAEQPAEPLPGYDKMNVDTVLSRLPSLDETSLYAVQAYELAHQNRVTVLRGVERALTTRPAPAAA
ncbi:MAG TPA: hypothetical protein PLO33_12200 [Kouleothrix sp.]|uniref:hypothetical protein n=1 Tax=Kouleothrix sp. TaxID=2779161 RepID=UPI002BFAE9B0|nr:hypothetical protein [Kouleothrix sp.]HRC76428.1 hypothetical protein [Kouleothrix sp.]